MCFLVILLSSSLTLPPPPSSTLFPYTTLFRSSRPGRCPDCQAAAPRSARACPRWCAAPAPGYLPERGARSEEHTSELQSRGHLVCRLLLEKKKAYKTTTHALCRAALEAHKMSR